MFPHRRATLIRAILSVILLPTVFLAYCYIKIRPSYALYDELYAQELQNSELVGKTEIQVGERRKYVMFKQLRGAGFNNQVQDILLHHNLALASSRTYVYHPFVWRPRGEESYVPLSAFLPGVTKDGVSSNSFKNICSEEETVHITLRGEHEKQWQHALDVLSRDDRCIVVDDWIFNWSFLATSGLHPVWPSFSRYLQQHFEWSQPILDIIQRAQTRLDLRAASASLSSRGSYIAIHLRRGDFESHCQYLSETQQGFTTWATLPNLQSSILSPPLDTSNASSIMTHCYPSLRRILSAITTQARRHPQARTLYVLHDGAIDHLNVYVQYYKLRTALMNGEWAKANHWPSGPMTRVLQSSDVENVKTWGENDYGVAVDVELARRAAGFVGNGYSSLSTQIIALRLADGRKPEDITLV